MKHIRKHGTAASVSWTILLHLSASHCHGRKPVFAVSWKEILSSIKNQKAWYRERERREPERKCHEHVMSSPDLRLDYMILYKLLARHMFGDKVFQSPLVIHEGLTKMLSLLGFGGRSWPKYYNKAECRCHALQMCTSRLVHGFEQPCEW